MASFYDAPARYEMNETCQGCGGPTGGELHGCPYAEDIGGDYESQCNCCCDCERNCADEI